MYDWLCPVCVNEWTAHRGQIVTQGTDCYTGDRLLYRGQIVTQGTDCYQIRAEFTDVSFITQHVPNW